MVGLRDGFLWFRMIRIVAFSPDKRPSIEEIISDIWLKEIRNLTDKELKECDEELTSELKTRE